MKRFSSYVTGLAPWILAVAAIGFCTRFRTFGKAGYAPDINYLLWSLIAVAVYTLIITLHFNGIDVSGLEYKDPDKNTILNCFDFSVLMIALLLLLNRVQQINALNEAIVMCMVSMAVSVLSLIAERSGRIGFSGDNISGSGVGGRLMLALVFIVVCGFSALTFNVAFSGVEKLSDALASGIKATGGVIWTILKFIGGLIARFIEWLISLMPEEEVVPLTPEAQPGVETVPMPELRDYITIPVWVYYAIAAVAIICFIIFIARNLRFGGKLVSVNRSKRVKRTKKKGSSALDKFRSEVRYRICCIKYKKSVPGLLVYCEKHAPKGNGRRKGESGEEFLRRMSDNPEIRTFAGMVEKQFYSAEDISLSKEEYKSIIKAWNTVSDQ